MTVPDAIVSAALLGFLAVTAWVSGRPRPTRGDDRHVSELRKLVAELTALRDQLDRSARGNGSRADSHLTTDNPTSRT